MMQEDILTVLGNRLKTIRKSKGLTQGELAALSGVSVRHISNIEKGCMNPSFVILYQLIKALDISMDNLLVPLLESNEETDIQQLNFLYSRCPQRYRKLLLSTVQTLAKEICTIENGKSDV